MHTNAIARTIGVLVVAGAGGCQPSAPVESPASAGVTSPTGTTTLVADTESATRPAGDTLHVVAEKTVQQLLQALSYNNIRPKLQRYSRRSVPTPANESSAQKSDSVITYSEGRNSVAFMKSGGPSGGALLLRCYLTGLPGGLTSTIRFGMSKTELGQLLAQPFTTDVVLASEEEGYQKFYFIFNQDKLQALHFESDYVD